jgi:hypothetical protein
MNSPQSRKTAKCLIVFVEEILCLLCDLCVSAVKMVFMSDLHSVWQAATRQTAQISLDAVD